MIRRLFWMTVAIFTGAGLFFISRFWDFRLWDRDSLLAQSGLTPQGGQLARWLRGSDLAPFELMIWAVVVFVVLTLIQKLFDRFS